MKRRLAKILAAVAMLATGAASMGCILFLMEDINSYGLFND